VNVQIPDNTNTIPLHPLEVLSLLGNAPFRWWIAGGWAIDLFLGQQSRPHFDVDIAIARDNQLDAQGYLNKWEFYSTKRDENGEIVLEKWKTGEILGQEHPGVWARESENGIWRFEFLFHEINDQIWTFRYDDSIQHLLEEIGEISSEDIPYLVPEIALLYKAARLRDIDRQDYQKVLPNLNQAQRKQLLADLQILDSDHPWLAVLDR
jgi:hypothetical protein